LKLLVVAGAISSLVACNTVRGLGEDLKSASNTVDRAT
jgi:predicted small secreted protein